MSIAAEMIDAVKQGDLDAVRDHLEPSGLRRILLATADAHGVYEKIGFKGLENPEKWMALGLQ